MRSMRLDAARGLTVHEVHEVSDVRAVTRTRCMRSDTMLVFRCLSKGLSEFSAGQVLTSMSHALRLESSMMSKPHTCGRRSSAQAGALVPIGASHSAHPQGAQARACKRTAQVAQARAQPAQARARTPRHTASHVLGEAAKRPWDGHDTAPWIYPGAHTQWPRGVCAGLPRCCPGAHSRQSVALARRSKAQHQLRPAPAVGLAAAHLKADVAVWHLHLDLCVHARLGRQHGPHHNFVHLQKLCTWHLAHCACVCLCLRFECVCACVCACACMYVCLHLCLCA